MNNKKTLIIVSVLLVVLIGGASLLYAKLGDNLKPDNLLIQNEPSQENGQNTATDKADATTSPDSDTSGENANESTNTTDNTSDTDYTAPDFTVYDRDGTAVRLSDFHGKPVILNFWASWCGPCKSEMPDFEELYQEYGEDIHFVMVNLTDGAQETLETATTFIEDSGYSFPVYYDTDSNAAMTYYVYAVPVTYFISAEGLLIAQGSGALDGETIKRGIELILE